MFVRLRPARLLTGVVLTSLALLTSGCMMTSTHDQLLDQERKKLGERCAGQLAGERDKCATAKTEAEATEKDRMARAAEELARTKKVLNDCTSKGGDSAKLYASCQLDRDEARQKLDRVSASINKVREALQVMSDAGKLQVKVARGFLVIALQGDILFDSGKSKLKEEAKPILLELAAILKTLPDRLFQVAGHTDDTGAEDLNWELSMQRALTVVQFLIKQGTVQGKNLSAGGYAMYQPVIDNTTDQNKQTNRRVEFLLIPNLSELLNLK